MKLLSEYEYKIPKIWFYEIKGVQDVVTTEELETAKRLPEFRAKIFLETRSCARKSLAKLFDLDPLVIPMNANPGIPPKLAPGMGNISFSHCNDAIVIAWHKEKIGIDIERKDRKFNHKKLDEKYFLNTNKSITRIEVTKTRILNQWCAVEAAIKWDHGTLSKDIRQWQYFEANKELIHKKKNLNLKFSQINFYQWKIVFTYKSCNSLNSNIICSEKKF